MLTNSSYIAPLLAALLGGCVAVGESTDATSAVTANRDSARVAASWSAMQRRFPACDRRVILPVGDRDAISITQLDPSWLADLGIDVGGRWAYPVCRIAPDGAGFVALVIETRSGVGDRDVEYRMVTRTHSGAPIADEVIASRRTDCSSRNTLVATLAFPMISVSEEHRTFDCEKGTPLETTYPSSGTIRVESSGAITSEITERN